MAWMTARMNCAPKMKKNVMKLKELSALQGKEHGGEEAPSPLVPDGPTDPPPSTQPVSLGMAWRNLGVPPTGRADKA